MTIFLNADKNLFAGCAKDDLLTALQDPRLPESFTVEPTDNYPGLAIISDDESRWYLGYIDLTDGEVVINDEPGTDDGKNPFRNPDFVKVLTPR